MSLDNIWEWSATAASNTDVGGISIAEGMARAGVNNAMREMMSQARELCNQGSDIASAGTTSIAASGTSFYAKVTGTTTITSFGTANAGVWRLLTFTGALTLTHNATSLILHGAANATTAAGDVFCFVSEGGGNWRELFLSSVAMTGNANTFTAAQTISVTAAGTALDIRSSDSGSASGPNLFLYRDSASPAASDFLSNVIYQGNDSGGNSTQYVSTRAEIVDATDGSEDSKYVVRTLVAGANNDGLVQAAGVYIGSPTGTDKGAGTLNATGVYVNGHGTVAQTVSATNAVYTTCGTILPFDNTIPQNTEGDQVLSVSITPTNASSTLYITFTGMVGGTTAQTISAALFVDSTAAALNATAIDVPNTAFAGNLVLQHAVSAGSTSAQTFKIRVGSSVASDAFLNGTSSGALFGGVATAVLRVEEVLPQ